MKNKPVWALRLCLFFSLAACQACPKASSPPSTTESRPILGTVEPLLLLPARVLAQANESDQVLQQRGAYPTQALIDTGSELSSIDLSLAQRLGLDKQIVGHVHVRNAHGRTRRPIIRLSFRLGGQLQNQKFTLASRQEMAYPILIGRNGLAGFLIDPSLGPQTD